MTKPTKKAALAIAAGSAAEAASPEHKRFRTLLARIERERARLADWQRELPLFARLHAERVAPAEAELTALRRAWAFELEDVLNGQRWPRHDAQTLAGLIAANALATLQEQAARGQESDPELEALHDRHAELPIAGPDFDDVAEVKRLLKEATGIELPDTSEDLPFEDVLHQVHERLQSDAQARDAEREARRAKRRAAKPSAAQLKADEAQARISQTVREVYRKLASALHPDRIGSHATPAERAQATQRMQRANSAYEAGDLLALLRLQLEIEQVDAEHIASVAVEQVKHFNRVLAEQLREIEREVAEREFTFLRTYSLPHSRRLDPARLGKLAGEQLSAIEGAKRRIAYDRRTLRGSPGAARALLKQWRAEQRLMEELRAARSFGF